MTTTSPARVPAPASGHPALHRLVALDFAAFAGDHWGREALLTRAEDLPRDFSDLFSAEAVDELVSTRGLRNPFLRLARDGATLPDRAFTTGGGIGAGIADQVSDDAVLRAFADGATLVLQGLHRTWEPALAFSQQLAADLGHPNQVNAYVTPPQSTGFSDHYDVHDVFVLQVAGEKRWRIRRPVREAPLRSEAWTDHRAEVESAARQPSVVEETLRPGDCLYLPRGFLHSATALGATSIHLTVGVHPWHRAHVAEALLESALRTATEDPLVRASLPVGIDVGDPGAWGLDVELVRSALHRALDEADPGALAVTLQRRHRAAQRPAPLRPLAQALAADRLRPEAVLLLRPHVAATLDREADRWVLRSRAGRLPVGDAERAAIDTLLSTGRATAADLGVETARRLVRAGVVVPA